MQLLYFFEFILIFNDLTILSRGRRPCLQQGVFSAYESRNLPAYSNDERSVFEQVQ